MATLATAAVGGGHALVSPPVASVVAGSWSVVFPGLVAIVLAAVHLFAGRLLALNTIPRSRFLSLAGGTSVAYVFVHVLPEVEHAGRRAGSRIGMLSLVEDHVYLVALLGFVSYYGLERFVRRTRDATGRETPPTGVFWLHIGSFTVYNGVIGYLLFHREAPGIGLLLTFAVAMALHFFVNDYGLRDHHEQAYRRVGRWVLAGGVLAGAVAGSVTALDRGLLDILFSFLAGGIILNVIKEELPAERESRFWAFALGAAGYAWLLLLL